MFRVLGLGLGFGEVWGVGRGSRGPKELDTCEQVQQKCTLLIGRVDYDYLEAP